MTTTAERSPVVPPLDDPVELFLLLGAKHGANLSVDLGAVLGERLTTLLERIAHQLPALLGVRLEDTGDLPALRIVELQSP